MNWFIDIIVHAIKRFSREIFHFKLSISLWNSPFLNIRQHWITNSESGIFTLMFQVFNWIGCYTSVLYLGNFSWCSWQNCAVWLCCISLSIFFYSASQSLWYHYNYCFWLLWYFYFILAKGLWLWDLSGQPEHPYSFENCKNFD